LLFIFVQVANDQNLVKLIEASYIYKKATSQPWSKNTGVSELGQNLKIFNYLNK
jgi:hypothetical protein